jgi:hypothetical protein
VLDRFRVPIALAAVLLGGALYGCAAMRWLAEPVGGSTIPPGPGPALAAPRAPGRACACPGEEAGPGLLMPEPARNGTPGQPTGEPGRSNGPSRGSVLVRTVATAGGALTGAPVAWALAGQLAHVLLGAVAGRRRRHEHPNPR